MSSNGGQWEEDSVGVFDSFVHVYPVGDLREHEISASCWCRPELNMDDVFVHNAMDGRESYEQGRGCSDA